MSRLFLYDGSVKSGLLWDESTDAWTYSSGAPESAGVQSYYKAIPTIYRGVTMIANAVSIMPFQIRGKGGTVIDDSADWKNALGFLPNPRRVFGLTSMSLDLTGCAYWSPRANAAKFVRQLQYFLPSTITPKFDDNTGALTAFERARKSGITESIKPADLYYFWLVDPTVENGPPQAYPVKAALSAAGVLANLDKFVSEYFARGAIRAQLVFAKGMPNKEERDRLENWFNRLLGGIKNAFRWKVFNADTLSTQTIGDGLNELRDVELTEQQQKAIALALGIPMARLFSEAANYATAGQDALDFYQGCIEPRCEFIAAVWNEQILAPLGYRLEFMPEATRVYQEEERQRAQAVAGLVSALATPEEFMIAAAILGYDIPDEAQKMLQDLMRKKEEAAAQMQAQLEQGGDGNEPPGEPRNAEPEEAQERRAERRANPEMQAEMERWRRKSMNAVKRGKAPSVDFESRIIPAALQGAIAGALDCGKTAQDVELAFADVWRGYP